MFEKLFEDMTLRRLNAIQFATMVLTITITLKVNQLWLAYIVMTVLTVMFSQIKKPFYNNNLGGEVFSYLALSVLKGFATAFISIGVIRNIFFFTFDGGVIDRGKTIVFIAAFIAPPCTIWILAKIANKEEYPVIRTICQIYMVLIILVQQKFELGWVFWP